MSRHPARSRTLGAAALIIFTALTPARSGPAPVSGTPEPGSSAARSAPAPDFALTDALGKNHSLSDYRGRFVVLEWVNYDCPFVKKHYGSGNMQKLQKEFTAKGVVWLSINSSAPGKQGRFTGEELAHRIAQAKAVPTAYLQDPDGKVGRLYQAKTTPTLFVIDPQGQIVYGGAIDDHPSTDQEDVPQSRNYVREALEAAMAGKPAPVASTVSYGCGVKYGD